jgi:hypothetical protein
MLSPDVFTAIGKVLLTVGNTGDIFQDIRSRRQHYHPVHNIPLLSGRDSFADN